LLVKTNRRNKYEWHFAYSSNCEEWKWRIQYFIDNTWNKFISWNPLLNDVIKLDASDTWSVDYTLSKLAVPLIKELHRTKHGYGLIDDSDVPKELRTGNNDHNEPKHDWFMQEIIWCLNEIAEGEPNSPVYGYDEDLFLFNSEERTPEQQRKVDEYMEECQNYDDRVQNGCILFGKYFRGLWD